MLILWILIVLRVHFGRIREIAVNILWFSRRCESLRWIYEQWRRIHLCLWACLMFCPLSSVSLECSLVWSPFSILIFCILRRYQLFVVIVNNLYLFFLQIFPQFCKAYPRWIWFLDHSFNYFDQLSRVLYRFLMKSINSLHMSFDRIPAKTWRMLICHRK